MGKFGFLACLGLALLTGCGTSGGTPTAEVKVPAVEAPAEDVKVVVPEDSMLVLVKMPEMTCDGCAANVRKDLITVDGIKILALDPKNNLAKLAVPKESKLDVKAELDKLAKTNYNIENFEIVKSAN